MKAHVRIYGLPEDDTIIDFEKECKVSFFKDGNDVEMWIDFADFPEFRRPIGMIRVKMTEKELEEFKSEINGRNHEM